MDDSNGKNDNGWNALWAGAVGLAGGYLLSRNFNSCMNANGGCGNTCGNNGCRTCFEQGVESGQNTCGLNYIAQQVAANAAAISGVNANVNTQFRALDQQKIADMASEIAALKTQQIVSSVGCQTNSQLSSIAQTLNSLVTGCAVRSVPACPTTPCNC